MLPPFIEGSSHIAPAYVDAARVAQLVLVLLVCAWRLPTVLRTLPAKPRRQRRQQTEPSRAQLLLQEDVALEPRLPARSSCARALRAVHALCCCLLLGGSAALLVMDSGGSDPRCSARLSWCVGSRAAGVSQWSFCLLLVLVEWRAGHRAGRGLRAWWVVSCVIALADALAALAALAAPAALRQPEAPCGAATATGRAVAVVQLASFAPALWLGIAALCEGDTPRAPPDTPPAPPAPLPCTLLEPSPDAPRPPAEPRASAFSRLTLSWVTPLLVRGRCAALLGCHPIAGGCNPLCRGLQPHVPEAASPCAGGCNPLPPGV